MIPFYQSIDIYITFCKALDEGAIFCDISKAFYRVWDKGILFKLLNLNLQVNLDRFITWFSEYLMTGNKQLLACYKLLLGLQLWLEFYKVPSLGPSCFSYILKALMKIINSSIRLFVVVVDGPIQAADQLNSNLVKIHCGADR